MSKKKSALILMRHGQSVWNAQNLFTGWVDIPLSQKGIDEARQGGKKIRDIPIDLVFTSTLVRAHMTLVIALLEHSSRKIPVFLHPEDEKLSKWESFSGEAAQKTTLPVRKAWQLNERMYGDLQGLNKKETAEKFGDEQVHIWRRSYDIAPPNGESLKMTADRTIPYFKQEVIPALLEGKNVFISAHGNSLRSIVMYLDELSKEEVLKLEIATGEPILYEFYGEKWTKISSI